ncbi:hypothetical protein [Albidovulum sp.]|uniref:hypothetical protein n=1 Tax=Albidovulum sp. TaxID=1872424 RepID=UPI0039B83128
MTLYAATNRLRQDSPDDPASGFSDARATTFSAARFSISIPPTHKAGNIEWPGRPLNAGQLRVGALNVGDPRVTAATESSGVALIDVGDIRSPDAQGHSRYAMLAALYPGMRQRPGQAISDAGAFVLERTEAAAAGPFLLIAGGIPEN